MWYRIILSYFHHHQQVHLHSVASNFIRRWKFTALHHRLRPHTRWLQHSRCASRLVRPIVGSYPLLPRHHRQILMCHGWLWHFNGRMRRRKPRPAGYSGRVWFERHRAQLIGHQPRGRFQPSGEGGSQGWKLLGDWLFSGLERDVSHGA